MKKVLIVVDMQNDFVDGCLGNNETKSVVSNIAEKIKEYKNNGWKVVFTRDTHYDDIYSETLEGKKLPIKHCIFNTDGWQVIDLLDDKDGIHINKETFGYEYWRSFFKVYGIDFDEIEICGVCTDICVVSNALALRMFYPNIPITVDASCCAGVTPETHKAALITMKSCQIDVIGA